MGINLQRTVNYFFIAYCIIKPVLESVFRMEFDGAGRFYVVMMLAVLFININAGMFRQSIVSRPNCIWWIWCVYAAIAWLAMGIPPVNDVPLWSIVVINIFRQVFVLTVVSYELQRDAFSVSRFIMWVFLFEILLCFTKVFSGSYSVREDGDLGNAFSLDAFCLLFVAAFRYVKGWISWRTFGLISLLSISACVVVATRKAIFAEFIVLVSVLLVKLDLRKASSVISVLFAGFLLFFIADFLLSQTLLGQRFASLAEEGETYNTTNNVLLNLLGDRAFFYVECWELFKSFPVFGIGLGNFRQVTGYIHPIHSELMVQLSETGLVGSVLYAFFFLLLFRNLFRLRFLNKELYVLFLGAIFAVLFIAITTWTYQFPRYFVMYGMMVGVFQKYKSVAGGCR